MRAVASVSSGERLGCTSIADTVLAVREHVQRALPQGVGQRGVGDEQDGVHGAVADYGFCSTGTTHR
jgi:hypothetical protein